MSWGCEVPRKVERNCEKPESLPEPFGGGDLGIRPGDKLRNRETFPAAVASGRVPA